MILFTFDGDSTLEQRTLVAGLVFDLSPVQLRLSCLLTGGADRAQAAAGIAISINTARTQLRRIFDKTGVHNRAALVRVLLSVAPPLR